MSSDFYESRTCDKTAIVNSCWYKRILACVAITLCSQCCWASDVKDGFAALESGSASKAVAIWTPLAEQGNLVAQQMLGALYAKSWGKLGWKADFAKAAYWYQKCELEMILCASGLADLHYYGRGVAYDRARAANLYRRVATAEIDYPEGTNAARVKLGMIYLGGEGVSVNKHEAKKFFQLAADEGDHEAQFWLGHILENGGHQTAEDRIEANKWYRLAIIAEDQAPLARSSSKRLEQAMTRKEVSRSRSLAASWKPTRNR